MKLLESNQAPTDGTPPPSVKTMADNTHHFHKCLFHLTCLTLRARFEDQRLELKDQF